MRVALRRRVEALFGRAAGEIDPYLGALLGITLEPDAAARVAELSPEALQYRTFEVVGALLGGWPRTARSCCAIEDLHWADPTSVQLAERLLPLDRAGAVLLLVAQREERDHPSWALRSWRRASTAPLPRGGARAADGRRRARAARVAVGPRHAPGRARGTGLAAAEGNPFFLEELVRSLADAGALVRDDAGWRFDHEVTVEIPRRSST